ncbi:KamA family protein [Streptomyces sp. 1114.5]|uniref:KamA family radical SAM protein n=1 Tax=Streptomyces sp. 1114.5 TaxID=1938830 RepID=UPI000EAE6DBA|nr:lysine 2,3-aminomutase [Streptomyces sp. 1114.5]RKT12303.1 KamA family protein [Streptomyces sp. 1114.5]
MHALRSPLAATSPTIPPRFRAYGARQLEQVARRFGLSAEVRRTVELVSRVLPFRVNDHVLSELIDWQRVPEDPMFQLLFPQEGMLPAADLRRLAALPDDSTAEAREAVREIRYRLNPHPSGQLELNVPSVDGQRLAGVQHKYAETVLYFPQQGQSCHSYCTYCFRWAQFVGDADLRFAAEGPEQLVEYLRAHPGVSDVLVTGGDPLVMSTERLRRHLEPLLAVESVRTIRIGTKAVAYWPQRFVTDRDADDLLRLFEEVVASGRTLAVMGHYSHPRELAPEIARRAVARIRGTGAVVYCQAPLIARVNDDPQVWTELWRTEFALGAVPYYLFVERDTGPHEYFKVPLAEAVRIFAEAHRRLPGLARTVRGPVMSAAPGKVVVDGVEEDAQGRYFQLRLLQARDPELVGRPFRAHWSADAAWLDELRPAEPVPEAIRAAIAPAPTTPAAPTAPTEPITDVPSPEEALA